MGSKFYNEIMVNGIKEFISFLWVYMEVLSWSTESKLSGLIKSELKGHTDLETINKTLINEKSSSNNEFISCHLNVFVILNPVVFLF